MGVDLYMENESGERLAEILDPHGFVNLITLISEPHASVCLCFVDPYGNTVFNQLQIPILVRELERVRDLITDETVEARKREYLGKTRNWPREAIQDAESSKRWSAPDVRDHLDRILDLARRTQDNVHTYLKFYGD